MSRAVKLDHNFDLEKYSDLLNKAKGSRSQTKFAKDCGLSTAYICKYLNANIKNAPTPTTIKKIAACAANDITLEQLLDAAGYDAKKYISSNPLTSDLNFKKLAQATILSNFTNFNFSWNTTKKISDDYDLSIDLSGNIINRWIFKFCSEIDFQDLNSEIQQQNRLFSYYGKILSISEIPKLKLSFVTDSKIVYKKLKELPPYMLAMYVSVILIDSKKMIVLNEEYLDSYFDITDEIRCDYSFQLSI